MKENFQISHKIFFAIRRARDAILSYHGTIKCRYLFTCLKIFIHFLKIKTAKQRASFIFQKQGFMKGAVRVER